VCVWVCVYTCVCVCVCIRVCVCVCIRMYTNTHTHTHTHIIGLLFHHNLLGLVYVYTCVYTHTHTHTHTHIIGLLFHHNLLGLVYEGFFFGGGLVVVRARLHANSHVSICKFVLVKPVNLVPLSTPVLAPQQRSACLKSPARIECA
jgi:hypothetical protein